MKKTLILPIFVLIALLGCQPKTISNYEVKDLDSSNLLVECHGLYPFETLYISINNNQILCETGDSVKGGYNIFRFFLFPDSIKTINIISKFNDRTIINKQFENHIYDKKLDLFISIPCPDTLKEFPTDVHWKPNWDYVPIDKSKRRIVLETITAPMLIL